MLICALAGNARDLELQRGAGMELTDNSLATLLLCSTLARDSTVPPLTDSVYEFLARELYARGLEPSDLLTRPPMWPQTEVPGWEMPLRVV